MPKEKKPAAKRKVGRPPFVIDYELVERLGLIHCTIAEIASIMGCSHDVLDRDERFSVIYKRAVDNGRMCLRRAQWAGAESGNATMLVWLGKQYLGQKDKHETETLADAADRIIEIVRATRPD